MTKKTNIRKGCFDLFDNLVDNIGDGAVERGTTEIRFAGIDQSDEDGIFAITRRYLHAEASQDERDHQGDLQISKHLEQKFSP